MAARTPEKAECPPCRVTQASQNPSWVGMFHALVYF